MPSSRSKKRARRSVARHMAAHGEPNAPSGDLATSMEPWMGAGTRTVWRCVGFKMSTFTIVFPMRVRASTMARFVCGTICKATAPSNGTDQPCTALIALHAGLAGVGVGRAVDTADDAAGAAVGAAGGDGSRATHADAIEDKGGERIEGDCAVWVEDRPRTTIAVDVRWSWREGVRVRAAAADTLAAVVAGTAVDDAAAAPKGAAVNGVRGTEAAAAELGDGADDEAGVAVAAAAAAEDWPGSL
mmetsp:Transcript_20005/g.63685  ORF Transcript_20005/g.63685 Transcript_20005/m.63685 type:complete len:244 (+) Transcript_20005:1032-1763(+)